MAEAAAEEAAEEAELSSIEERIRAYREEFEQRKLERDQFRPRYGRRDEELRKRREAMQKYFNKRMDERLTILEKRQEQLARKHEAMRNSAQDRYNFLTRNSEDMINKALDEQIEIANRHEQLRKQAEERHRRMAAHRDAMLDMTPEQRRIYMDEHADEIFGKSGSIPSTSVPPRQPKVMRRSPPLPPWAEYGRGDMPR